MPTRWMLVAALACSCGGDDGHPTIVLGDAAVDAARDAAPDAPPDAPAASTEIVDACTHMCDRIGECLEIPTPAGCVEECSADLADCTPSQVVEVDACSQAKCGDNGDGLGACLTQIACVDG